MKMRRPQSGSFAKITTPESKRAIEWKVRDLSQRPERRVRPATTSKADKRA